MITPRFFGYGSLVNRNTHSYVDVQPLLLSGWRRVWRQTAQFPRPILTIEPHEASAIHGVTAGVPGADWQALDQREHAYDRVMLPGAAAQDGTLATYVIAQDKYPPAPRPHPIYLSYLDVVVQGFLQEFGLDGVRAFFDSTAGWAAGIRNDRAAPLYPRHQVLTAAERNLVDGEIARLNCPIFA